jgi:zinc transport system substrate-binding protein
MKRHHVFQVVVASIVTLGLSACTTEKPDEVSGTRERQAGKPVVYVSNYPLQYFVERLASPLVDARFAAGVSGDPAYWNPKPEDVSAMQKSDLIVLNGASYEQWLGKVSLPQSKLVDTSAGFRDRLIALEESVTHSHGLEGEHEHAGTAFTTWLDMTLAIEQARAVKDALAARWPERKTSFEDRFAQLEKDLQALDDDIKAAVASAPDRGVVFSHPVYQYLQKRYGIKGRSVHWEPDQTPDDEMRNELREMLKTQPAQWMIWEGEPLPDVVEKLKPLGMDSAVVDPCGNTPDDGDFLGVMRRNVESLQRVFATE